MTGILARVIKWRIGCPNHYTTELGTDYLERTGRVVIYLQLHSFFYYLLCISHFKFMYKSAHVSV